MKVKTINLDDADGLESIGVTLTVHEVGLIATVFGRMLDDEKEHIFRGAADVGTDIYLGLEQVANMIYEDGVPEMVRTLS